MKIVVNGDSMEVSEGATLTHLLGQLKLKSELVVVELNLNILKREHVSQTTLKEGDQVEIVHFVGGGASAASASRNHLSGTGIRRHASGPQRGPALSLALAPDRNLRRSENHAPLALREGLLTPYPRVLLAPEPAIGGWGVKALESPSAHGQCDPEADKRGLEGAQSASPGPTSVPEHPDPERGQWCLPVADEGVQDSGRGQG